MNSDTLKAGGITGIQLKGLAIASMLADHAVVVLLAEASPLYLLLHGFGRLAFPVYCFLIAEGARHTKSFFRYALRLLLFATLSEVPFDLAFSGTAFDMQHQNVFWTLLIGLLVLWAVTVLEKAGRLWFTVAPFAAGMLVAQLLHTDYGARGVLLIVTFFLAVRSGKAQWLLDFAALCVLAFRQPIQLYGLLALVPLYFYNGQKGKQPRALRYALYAFYPLHLLLLVLVRCIIK